MNQPQSRSRELIAEGRAVIAGMKRNGYSDILWEKILDAIESEWSETGPSDAVELLRQCVNVMGFVEPEIQGGWSPDGPYHRAKEWLSRLSERQGGS
jgi:hypothetical protein